MKWFVAIAVLMASMSAASFSIAGDATGTVSYVTVRDTDGLVYFWLSGAHTNPPACANGTGYWMIANENSETGKRHFAMLMLAKAMGMTIHVSGKNTCTR